MPELPEVETIVTDLKKARLKDHTICSVQVFWRRTIACPSVPAFKKNIAGQSFVSFRRRGKFIVCDLSGGKKLLIHLRMSGRLEVRTAEDEYTRHEHVAFLLDDGRELRFHDTRKFGRMYLVDSPEAILGKLGVEPLSKRFSRAYLKTICSRHDRQLKPFLLDQSVIAGLGNIYVDEALWRAGLDPRRKTSSLADSEISALYEAIPAVLNIGIRNMGTTLGNGNANFYSVAKRKGRNRDQLKVFRRTGLPCPKCGQAIQRIIVAQRSTHICERCQK